MRRRIPVVLVSLLALSLTACGDDGGSGGGESFDPPEPTVDLPEGTVVFSPADAEQDAYGDPVSWTPDADDVAAADDLLATYLDDHAELDLDPLDTYHRQYVGIGPDGEALSVNALCQGSGLDDWEDGLIVVADGGTCFWQAHVFLTAGAVRDVSVNGYA
jgi:hypothetical protein